VKTFSDSSVLVPVFHGDHAHHPAILWVLLQFPKADACFGAHTLAEIYSTLTRMPGKYRVTGDQAMLFVGSVLARFVGCPVFCRTTFTRTEGPVDEERQTFNDRRTATRRFRA
jgi:hypothetical protein